MLDGTTNKQDARLIADIDAADPFDGGCAADCATPDIGVTFSKIERANRTLGLLDCHDWLVANGHQVAADALFDAHHFRGEVLK